MGQILVWIQLNGQFNWEFGKENRIIIAVVAAVPISLLFMYGTKYLYDALGGSLWSIRLTGLGIGTVLFFLMTWLIGSELPDVKNSICLILALFVILIQMFWK